MLFSWVRTFIICQVQQIINTGVMKFSQLDQNVSGNIYITTFIITVNTLTAIQDFTHILLRKVTIFTQISYSLIHAFHLWHNNNLARYSLLKYSEKFATLNLKMQEGEVQSERESEKGAGVDF